MLIRNRETGAFEDQTHRIARYELQSAGQRIAIFFANQHKGFPYGRDRVRILRSSARHVVAGADRVEVNGAIWNSATETTTFVGADGAWSRVVVRDKLDELGFGHVLGNLGRKQRRAEFFAGQENRGAAVARFVASAPPPPDPNQLAQLDRRLRGLQEDERVRADRRQALDASLDFVVYNQVTNRPLLAIEVDGFAFHENKPAQLKRDELKNDILRRYDMPLLRLPTTGSGEDQRIRNALTAAESHWTRQ
ncbi:DUF2726 domain-containing protein [Actinophytocola sediminis]